MKTDKVALFLSLISLNCAISFPLWGVIEDVGSIADLQSIVHRKMKEHGVKSEDTLFAIGLDRVIFHPAHLPFQVQNLNEHWHILQDINHELSQEHTYLIYNSFTKKGPLELIESTTPEILRELQEEHIKVIGLTAYLVGPIEEIENNEVWATHTLKDQFKIDFSKAFEGVDDLELKEAPAYRGKLPHYYKGILHANGRGEEGSKGKALRLFLNQLVGYQPRLIFYMDDIKEHLTLLEEELKIGDLDTNFVGLNYRYRETDNRDNLIDAETFEKAWRELAEECRPKE